MRLGTWFLLRKAHIVILGIVAGIACIASDAVGGMQVLEFSSTMNPVGSGARATGMGGAFIGVADDATAASWNPAGLIQLEKPELSIVGTRFDREQSFASASQPEAAGFSTMSANGINFASIVYPFQALNRNMVVSLSYQRVYEMAKSARWNLHYLNDPPPSYIDSIAQSFQTGFMYAVSPAIAVQITPDLSLGVTFNIWDDHLGKNGWQQDWRTKGSGVQYWCSPNPVIQDPPLPPICSTYTQYLTQEAHIENKFKGRNLNAGFLWNPTASITLGGVVKTAFKADIATTEELFTSWTLLEFMFVDEQTTRTSSNGKLNMPPSYGLGIQYRVSDELTFALDASRIEWSRSYFQDPDGARFNPVSRAPYETNRLRSVTQVRFGTEYLIIGNSSTVPLRFGLFSDPEPNTGRVDRYHGFSLGTGYSTPQYAADLSYQRRTGKGVTSDIRTVSDMKADVTQETYMLSLIFYF